MGKYLYGASVQGIQSFIFQTNKLKEIAGASELIEQICTNKFAESIGKALKELEEDGNAIINAAGNIKYLFNDEKSCQKVVLEFPKKIMEFAPGITISQAVVKVESELFKNDIDELEKKLRAQRNKAHRPHDIGLIAVERSRHTGLPANKSPKNKEDDSQDYGTVAKNAHNKSNRLFQSFLKDDHLENIPFEMDEIVVSKSSTYSWIAVIHADGNNLGLILQNLAKEVSEKAHLSYLSTIRSFSKSLDLATKQAAENAFLTIVPNPMLELGKKYPFRPIVIGGDDLTIICRADLALDFTATFLKEFEKQTKEQFTKLGLESIKDGLTACTGISYIKKSYPFHYGYNLAETLCSYAKKQSKLLVEENQPTPSSLMFHKVQGSFVEDFQEIKIRELKAKSCDVWFDYGPYFINAQNNRPTVSGLLRNLENLEGKEGNVIKSHLRQWLSDMHVDKGLASQKMDRIISVASKETKHRLENLEIPKRAISGEKSPIYDWLTIHSINQGGN